MTESIWHGNPPQNPVNKVLLRYTDGDPEYVYMLCSWVENTHEDLVLVEYEFGDRLSFNLGDQWMELENEVPNEPTT